MPRKARRGSNIKRGSKGNIDRRSPDAIVPADAAHPSMFAPAIIAGHSRAAFEAYRKDIPDANLNRANLPDLEWNTGPGPLIVTRSKPAC